MEMMINRCKFLELYNCRNKREILCVLINSNWPQKLKSGWRNYFLLNLWARLGLERSCINFSRVGGHRNDICWRSIRSKNYFVKSNRSYQLAWPCNEHWKLEKVKWGGLTTFRPLLKNISSLKRDEMVCVLREVTMKE